MLTRLEGLDIPKFATVKDVTDLYDELLDFIVEIEEVGGVWLVKPKSPEGHGVLVEIKVNKPLDSKISIE